jgi:hypothetical protein
MNKIWHIERWKFCKYKNIPSNFFDRDWQPPTPEKFREIKPHPA